MGTIVLCPGQGAQVVGMGKDLCASSAAARQVFDRADDALGWKLSAACFVGPQEKLNQTDISQPALYVCGIASFAASRESGALDPQSISAYAGLSLGEYTALHLAGSLSFEDGLRLVAARGRFMQEAAVASASSMVAILGADERQVEGLCAQAAEGQVLVPANFNAPGQIVVSGSKAACQRVLKLAETRGFKATELKVAGAFHSPLMQSAAQKMEAELKDTPFQLPAVDVYSNVTARPHEEVDSIRRLLVQQIVSSVQWERIMRALLADESANFVELAPGRTLAGLAKRINRRAVVRSISELAARQTDAAAASHRSGL